MSDILFQNKDFNDEYQPPSIIQQLQKQDSEEIFTSHIYYQQDFIPNNKKEITYDNITINKDIKLVDDQTLDSYDFKNQQFKIQKFENENTIPFQQIIQTIEKAVAFSLDSFLVSIQDPSTKMYIFIDDIKTKKIDLKAFQSLPELIIRLKPTQSLIQQQESSLNNNTNTNNNNKNEQKRVRERTIQEVIEKVQQWRTLFDNGIPSKNMENQYQRLTLQQAAQIVGYSKKSLDNYHLQIKRGQKLGFDFSKHANAKIGVLRQFNNKQNIKNKQEQKEEEYEQNIQQHHQQIQNDTQRQQNIIINQQVDFNNNINNYNSVQQQQDQQDSSEYDLSDLNNNNNYQFQQQQSSLNISEEQQNNQQFQFGDLDIQQQQLSSDNISNDENSNCNFLIDNDNNGDFNLEQNNQELQLQNNFSFFDQNNNFNQQQSQIFTLQQFNTNDLN